MPDRIRMEVHLEPSLDIGEERVFMEEQDQLGSLAKLEADCAPTRKLSSLVKKVAGELGTVER